jgi:hypothetical protein
MTPISVIGASAGKICPAQHGIGFRAVAWYCRQVIIEPVMLAQQIEAPSKAGQRAKGQDIDFKQLECVNVVLVHSSTVRPAIAALPTTAILVSCAPAWDSPPVNVGEGYGGSVENKAEVP